MEHNFVASPVHPNEGEIWQSADGTLFLIIHWEKGMSNTLRLMDEFKSNALPITCQGTRFYANPLFINYTMDRNLDSLADMASANEFTPIMQRIRTMFGSSDGAWEAAEELAEAKISIGSLQTQLERANKTIAELKAKTAPAPAPEKSTMMDALGSMSFYLGSAVANIMRGGNDTTKLLAAQNFITREIERLNTLNTPSVKEVKLSC